MKRVMTQKRAVISVLDAAAPGEWFPYTVITPKAQKIVHIGGKTPHHTVNRILLDLTRKGIVETKRKGSGLFRIREGKDGQQIELFKL